MRTKATKKLLEWEETKKLNDVFRLNNPLKNEATYIPDTEQNRKYIKREEDWTDSWYQKIY